jgi:hypothetical protein
MTDGSGLYQACQDLFADYPLAARVANRSGSLRTMVLAVPTGDSARFYILMEEGLKDRPRYSFHPWRGTETVLIGAADEAAPPEVAVDAVACGVPMPRHGSLFGWLSGDIVTALIPVYTTSTPTSPEPSWTVLPRADVPETQWPPFADEELFGHWFWDYYQDEIIVCLANMIAGTQNTVFWVDTAASLGTNCFAVADDIKDQAGRTLPHGRYVTYTVLRARRTVPSLADLLTDPTRTDVSSRLRAWLAPQPPAGR